MQCLIKRGLALCLFGYSLLLTGAAQGRDQTPIAGAVEAKQGMVVAVSPLAADAGVQMLRDGGNAVDAAVATAFAEAVTWPAAGNIGGGGFMVIYPRNEEPIVVDYREKAPLAATPTMLEKRDANFAYKTVGVPGTVAGLTLAHQKFGKLGWKHVLAPAVKLAEDGFPIDRALASSLNSVIRQAPAGSEFAAYTAKTEARRPGKRAIRCACPIWRRASTKLPTRGHTPFTKARLPKRSLPRCRSAVG